MVLQHACDKLAKLRTKCENFISKYEDLIVNLLMQELTPKMVCRELGMCIIKMNVESEVDALKITVVAVPVSRQQPNELHFEPITNGSDDIFTVASDETVDRETDPNVAYIHASDSTICVICQTVMTQLEKELADKKNQKEIEDAIKGVCNAMPKSFNDECTKFIDNYATLIISLIDTTPPKQICSQISLCAASSIVESKCKSRRIA